ncbi:MAG: DUF6524 family protein [Pseudomonadota bacterium]
MSLKPERSMLRRFTLSSFVIRWVAALFLVFAAYNTTGYSYFHWLASLRADLWGLKLVAGVLLLVALWFFLAMTWRVIGPRGIIVSALFCLAVGLVPIGLGLVDAGRWSTLVNMALVGFATIMAIGVSWAPVTHRVTGVATTEQLP